MSKKLQITMPVVVDIDDIVGSMSEYELSHFIVSLDEQIANADFTEGLIKRLVKSLRGDLTPEEFATLIEELRA